MCLQIEIAFSVPEQTKRIALAAFPNGNLYLQMRDELGMLFTDDDFVTLYPKRGQPALAPWRLALVTVMQFIEGLSDRQAADAVRARIDWKYALGIEMTDPGFHYSVLSEFRSRLIANNVGQMLLDKVLTHLQGRKLLKARGRQRTDSTHVLAAIRVMNRLELVTETLRAALNKLAAVSPDWLRSIAPAGWYTRYSLRAEQTRMPSGEKARREFAEAVGRDGYRLLAELEAQKTEAGKMDIQALAVMQTLRQVWERHFVRSEAGEILWRADAELARAATAVESPYDTHARHSNKHDLSWTGYKVHLTETCDPELPRLITNVHTTVATTQDVSCTKEIQQHLADRDLLPQRHLVDTGYVDAHLLVDSQQRHGIELFGPTRYNPSWQAREGGYDQSRFVVDWQKEQATCPEGKVSVWWGADRPKVDRPKAERPEADSSGPDERARLKVRFRQSDCTACQNRAKCVRSEAGRPRTLVLPVRECYELRECYEALQQARTLLSSEEGRAEYRKRAGIEGTLSQGVRHCDLRHSRYRGLSKTNLQHVMTAAGLNVLRAVNHLNGEPLAPTRKSRFARLCA